MEIIGIILTLAFLYACYWVVSRTFGFIFQTRGHLRRRSQKSRYRRELRRF